MPSSIERQTARGEKPYLELRWRPPGEKARPRRLGLSRTATAAGLTIAGLWVLFVLFGSALAFPVASSLLRRHEYEARITERTTQGKRLQSLVEALEAAADRADAVHLRLQRVLLAYGLRSPAEGEPAEALERPASTLDTIYSGVIARGGAVARSADRENLWTATVLAEIETFESRERQRSLETPSILPLRGVRFVQTSSFGMRRDPYTEQIVPHPGIDLAAPPGTPIRAPADGIVVFASQYPLRRSTYWWRLGKLVAVRSGDRFISLFGHCDEILVRDGQQVRRGEPIATVGNSGWSTSPHLHYEIRRRDADGQYEPVDPRLHVFDHPWPDERQIVEAAVRPLAPQAVEALPRGLRR